MGRIRHWLWDPGLGRCARLEAEPRGAYTGSMGWIEPGGDAAFNVLKTAKVPAILLELGYLTNEADAEQLNSDQWRDRVSSSLVTAIEEYFRDEVALKVKPAASDLVDSSC